MLSEVYAHVCLELFKTIQRLPLHLHRWFVYKHSKPLPADIVKFQPYPDSQDRYRGTTVLPYLETFFNYGVDDNGLPTMDRGATAGESTQK